MVLSRIDECLSGCEFPHPAGLVVLESLLLALGFLDLVVPQLLVHELDEVATWGHFRHDNKKSKLHTLIFIIIDYSLKMVLGD